MQEKPQRKPTQQRSRERLERILDVAEGLIEEKGSEHVKMSEIADLAEISIGSLYQYFPDKRAIIRSLAEAYATESRECVRLALEAVRNQKELVAAFSELVDLYYRIVLEKPVMRDISSALRADKELMSIELSESRACGAMLAAAIMRVRPRADAKRIGALAFLIWQLGEETMRLAIAHKRSEGALLVDVYKRMSLRAIEEG
ncbi:TetR/AcrR family transcriptional regulator [Caballeronia sp. BR00000012568055]|uniref:TetR/AcrR family transcriptional regulator n=1 Tax=Caballeronia sp. BR00000012568055 TaxID=2918761 RepID=UPI0023F7F554|nr:TetR family transcriptional regulator [Caballeronia sp. BR00000012568055]